MLAQCYLDSPVGRLLLSADGSSLTGVRFPPSRAAAPPADVVVDHFDPVLRATCEQLSEYFTGRRLAFELPLAAHGSDFQQRVWAGLSCIPFGETISYGELAARLGDKGASRAVGLANNRNPIPIIIPCHRVIGADGSLVGFGGGLERKQWLLRHEATLMTDRFELR
jgi:methylated-DNA-[protein]-cysteine S-methyltransferase